MPTYTGTPVSAPAAAVAAGAGLTRLKLREEVARFFGLFASTVTSGTGSTIVCNGLARYADDYWNGANLLLLTTVDGAAPQGESAAFVTDFVRSTTTLSFEPALTASVDVGDVFELYQNVTIANIHAALNQACQGALVRTNLVPSGDTLDYNITGAVDLYRPQQITGVWRRDTGTDSLPHEIVGYQVEDAEGCLLLRLPYLLDEDDDFWITYTAGEYSLANDDTAVINLPMALIKARAIVWLLERHAYNMDSTGRDKQGMFLRYWQEQLVKADRAYQRPSQKVAKHVWGRDIGTAIDGDLRAVTY
jgi:hypothetical protein